MVDEWGIEPQSSVCHTDVLPLYDKPVWWTVTESNRFKNLAEVPRHHDCTALKNLMTNPLSIPLGPVPSRSRGRNISHRRWWTHKGVEPFRVSLQRRWSPLTIWPVKRMSENTAEGDARHVLANASADLDLNQGRNPYRLLHPMVPEEGFEPPAFSV